MNKSIVSHSEPILLIGAAPLPAGAIRALWSSEQLLVACDGGADAVIAAGLRDHLAAVIGDMDSIEQGHDLPIHEVAEQDTTDFDKALRHLVAPLILGLGFWGGRADHQMAVLSTLVTHADRPCLLVTGEELIFAAPPDMQLTLLENTRVSIWPLLPVQGQSEGLHWPIDDLDLRPDGRLGTSNRASGGRVSLSFDRPGALMVLPRAALQEVSAALRAATRWPAARAG